MLTAGETVAASSRILPFIMLSLHFCQKPRPQYHRHLSGLPGGYIGKLPTVHLILTGLSKRVKVYRGYQHKFYINWISKKRKSRGHKSTCILVFYPEASLVAYEAVSE